MRISCQSFSMPKAGRNFADCEDAYYPYDAKNLEVFETALDKCELFRCSVSDGATDSIFSKLWAQLLSEGYGSGKWGAEISAESILDDQKYWHEFLAKQELPWYAEEKAEMGAFAATAGLTIYENSNRWSALALGDCCIFQIRNGECISAFPIDNSAGFSNFPLLLSSVSARNNDVFESKKVISDGVWQSGDQFFLMSDTVACWFLGQIESGKGNQAVTSLNGVKSLSDFVAVMNKARTTTGGEGNVEMRDDDVTVTVITVADGSAAPLQKRLNIAAGTTSSVASTSGANASDAPRSEKRSAVELPNVPRKAPGGPGSAAPSAGMQSSGTRYPSVQGAANQDPSLSTGFNAALKQPRTSSTTLPQFEEPKPVPSANGDDDYPEDAFVGRRKFAQSRQRASSSSGKGPLIILSTIILGAGAAGFVWFNKPKTAPQPVKVKAESVTAPTAQSGKPEEIIVRDGKHRRRHHAHSSQSANGTSNAAPNAVTTNPSDSERSPVNAANPNGTMPAPAPNYARPSAGEMPASAPSRHHVPLPTTGGDASATAAGMPPQAPERVHGDQTPDHGPIHPSRHAKSLPPLNSGHEHHSDSDTPVNFSQQN